MTICGEPRVVYRGTTEYLDVPVTSNLQLDAQPVAFSFDNRATWLTAQWTGDVGTTRTASLLLTPDNTPADSQVEVLVRITDDPEAPIMSAGQLVII